MKSVAKSVLIWYRPQEMYDLVVDVPSYPQFLPWCSDAKVLEQASDFQTAQLSLSFGGISQRFTTQNTLVAGHSVGLALVDGPFSVLRGQWTFAPLRDFSQRACRITLNLEYDFASAALAAVVGPVFDKVANTLVDAFVERAEKKYAK
jgi:ribosome-associated toxin RatA of RatAB toxin-antitoxin module